MEPLEVKGEELEEERKKMTTNCHEAFRNAEIARQIVSYLPRKQLKDIRLINRVWHSAASKAWKAHVKITFKSWDDLHRFFQDSARLRHPLPFSVRRWIFQGETVRNLIGGELVNMQRDFAPFWRHVHNLVFYNWTKQKCRIYGPDGKLENLRLRSWPDYRCRFEYYTTTTNLVSSYKVMEMLDKCENLTQFQVHYQLLTTIPGKHIRPGQFPQLEKLTYFQIFYHGNKWNPTLDVLVRKIPEKVEDSSEGGSVLIQRILENSPNLVQLHVTSFTILTSKMETWFAKLLVSPSIELPKLKILNCSIPVDEEICHGLQSKDWSLSGLKLRVMGEVGVYLPAKDLYDMVASFKDTLLWLELVFLGEGECSSQFLNADQLSKLKTLELWGYRGSYKFLSEFRRLGRAVVGVTQEYRERTGLMSYVMGAVNCFKEMKQQLKAEPNLRVRIEPKTVADFHRRVDQDRPLCFDP